MTGTVNPLGSFAQIGPSSSVYATPSGRLQNFLAFCIFEMQPVAVQSYSFRLNVNGFLSVPWFMAANSEAGRSGMLFLSILGVAGQISAKLEVGGTGPVTLFDGTINIFLLGG